MYNIKFIKCSPGILSVIYHITSCVTLHNYCCFGGQYDDLATGEMQYSLNTKGEVNKVL